METDKDKIIKDLREELDKAFKDNSLMMEVNVKLRREIRMLEKLIELNMKDLHNIADQRDWYYDEYQKLKDKLKISGGYLLGEWKQDVEPAQIESLKKTAGGLYPELDFSDMRSSAGLRPCTPDSIPICGKSTKIRNLYVNAGHGMYGWALAHVTSKKIADKVLLEKRQG